MKWFPGPYSLACQVSKKNKALLVVFIDDQSENSQRMDEICAAVDQSIFTCPVCPVHLRTVDNSFKDFTFPTPVLPAVYFIDDTSTVLRIVTLEEADNVEAFKTLTEEIVKNVSENLRAAVETPSKDQNTETSGNDSELTLDEKIRRAKELLEKKHKDEEEKKKSEEKEKELERIRTGKLMQEAAQKRQEQELKESAAQRRREKMEAEAEKQRILDQIKADKEDREARLQRNTVTTQDEVQPSVVENARPPLKVESDRCRIQVRLPDSNTLVEEFASSEKLGVLIDVISKSGQVQGDFNLVQPFPRHVFAAEEMDKSFVDLYLTPSCTLTVEQKRLRSSSQLTPSKLLSYIPFLFSFLVLSPLNYVFGIIRNFLGPNSSAEAKKKENPPKKANRRNGEGDTTIRRRGNVSGLHNPNQNPNDEDASWNGNSTQFM